MEFLSNTSWLLALTFLLYFLSLQLQTRYRSPFLSPILLTTAFLIGYLMVFNIPYEKYASAGSFIEFWLKPSVVALAIPLYLQIERIKKQLLPILVSQFVGSFIGIVSVCTIAKLMGASREIIISLSPKSVTTPIAIEVSSSIGGLAPLTATAVIFTGIIGSILGIEILKFSRIHSPMAQGISLGTASHGLGVMLARGLSEKYAAFASLGLIINGVFTAVMTPLVVGWFF